MVEICNYQSCTGCGLCASRCPKQSIVMSEKGPFGHLYPVIDQATCIDCGVCNRICPAKHSQEYKYPIKTFAAWCKDKQEYITSTSGGAASVLSRYVLLQDGIVYGCAMLPNIEVRHIRVDNLRDVQKLKGSKYVQSNIVDILPLLKQDVMAGKMTLFIGTPCQVAAVKALFQRHPDNLLLVDLICHGVPSVSLLKEHVKNVSSQFHYDNIVFREGKNICIKIIVGDKVVYKRAYNKPRYKDWFINTFFDGFTYRDSCYKCIYARPQRISDITIGDFWGLGKRISVDEIPPHEEGCSVVLPTTDKGMNLLLSISSELNLYERSFEEAVEGNAQLRKPTELNRRKKVFFALYPYLGHSAYYIVIMDKYVKCKLKKIKKRMINI